MRTVSGGNFLYLYALVRKLKQPNKGPTNIYKEKLNKILTEKI